MLGQYPGRRCESADDGSNAAFNSGACHSDLGVPPGRPGTFIADVTDPTNPRTVGFLDIPRGSHNMTVHPNGKFLYNSNADGTLQGEVLTGKGQVEVWDISRPSNPRLVKAVSLLPDPAPDNDAVPSPPGASSHDITFSADGTRAYSAAINVTVVMDTTNPASPTVIGHIVDPAVDYHHQADPVVVETPAGPKTLLVVSDELAGGASYACPGGGLHVYDVTGSLERTPVKLGAYFAPYAGSTFAPGTTQGGVCTSHVLRMHPEEKILTLGWYGLGSRVVDFSGLSGLFGASAGVDEKIGSVGAGMREVGYLHFEDSTVWTAKTNRIAKDGSFFLYANDYERGLDVLRYTPPTAAMLSAPEYDPGRWLSPEEALDEAQARPAGTPGGLEPFCRLSSL